MSAVVDVVGEVQKKLPSLKHSVSVYFREQARILAEIGQFDPNLIRGLTMETAMRIFGAETDVLIGNNLIVWDETNKSK